MIIKDPKHRYTKEFQEIGHCGGQFTVNIKTDDDGRRGYQLGYKSNRPNPMTLCAIYTFPNGLPMGIVQMGGIGDPFSPPPIPGCYPLFIGSDSLGMFGHRCEGCDGYWRSNGAPSRWRLTCPYCGQRAEGHHFLTEGQRRYLEACCELINNAMEAGEDGHHEIDMDEVADAVSKDIPKPSYYYSDVSQQNLFDCQACGESNDILGRYGYCSCCGTHNGVREVFAELDGLSERVDAKGEYESCVKNAVSAFDAYARKIAKQFADRIPMTPRYQKDLEHRKFHNLNQCEELFRTRFDIKIFGTIKQPDRDFVALMFHRRHVYEHNGGEVDEKYIQDSGDKTIKLKQRIYESKESASRMIANIKILAQNLHVGFHLIFPPEDAPIQTHKHRLQRMEEARKRPGL